MITTASKITLVRIFLIPVFVLFACYYGESVRNGAPEEWLRYTAIGVFLLASLSDGLDGYIARLYGQISRLGKILDPIADKGLLLATLLTLAFAGWGYALPIWFMVLVIARDVVIVSGSLLLHHVNGAVQIRASLFGKITTALQMTAIAWTLLQLPNHLIPIAAAGIFTFISGFGYILDGLRQMTQPVAK
jgi:CDP-diacylglycerol--glycerol-3-phosphate 3-phosphatidyltransferase